MAGRRASQTPSEAFHSDTTPLEFELSYVIVLPTVGYTSVVTSVIHSRQWSN